MPTSGAAGAGDAVSRAPSPQPRERGERGGVRPSARRSAWHRMAEFGRMPIWEAKRRLRDLRTLAGSVHTYFGNLEPTAYHFRFRENVQAEQARQEINRVLAAARDSVRLAGIGSVVLYKPPGATTATHLDVLANVLRLPELGLDASAVMDVIQQAMGRYEGDLPAARRRTYNPVFWLDVLVSTIQTWLVRLLGPLADIAAKIAGAVRRQ